MEFKNAKRVLENATPTLTPVMMSTTRSSTSCIVALVITRPSTSSGRCAG
jgi:hypothetical protein